MKRLWLLFSQVVTVLLAAYFVVLALKPGWMERPRFAASTGSFQVPAGTVPPGSFRLAAAKGSAAVVSISTSKTVARNPQASNPWFRFFYGDPEEQSQSGLGSGVIVSSLGHILTNNHVIDGADEIEVTLNDRRQATARVVGTDPETDLAVLKIELDKLPAITLGASDDLQVGDQVLAIGNPFGVGQTVTSGIVSALGRNQLHINTFEDFIQTDAAINPGNSGGALVDIQGNLLGINTAIYSRSGGSLGIGFAIPMSTAKMVLDSIVKNGRVTRGWIGVEPSDLSSELAETFGIKLPRGDSSQLQGAIITGVLQGGPAAQAGIQPGDVINRVAGKPVGNVAQLLSAVAALPPGKAATIGLIRRTEQKEISVTPGIRPAPKAALR
jgi:serine protease DegQ